MTESFEIGKDTPKPAFLPFSAHPIRNNTRSFKILAIDDDPLFLRSLQRVLTDAAYALSTLTNPEQALATVEAGRFDLVLLDLKMPGRDGFSVLADLISHFPQLIVIILTGHGGVQEAV